MRNKKWTTRNAEPVWLAPGDRVAVTASPWLGQQPCRIRPIACMQFNSLRPT